MTRSAGVDGALTGAPQCWVARGSPGRCGSAPAHPATPGNDALGCTVAVAGASWSSPRPWGQEQDMGLFDRLRGRRAGGGSSRGRGGTLDRASGRADLAHLEQFVATRRGVEGYVEPRTAVTETTLLLAAPEGEWTRGRIDGPDAARRLSRELAVPVYDAQVTG